jgi:hypothetical protein
MDILNTWTKAVAKKDLDAILHCYADDAVLCPMLGDTVKRGYGPIRSYFIDFIQKIERPVEWLGKEEQPVSDTYKVISGQFRLHLLSGVKKARYTFNLILHKGEWKIHTQHISAQSTL